MITRTNFFLLIALLVVACYTNKLKPTAPPPKPINVILIGPEILTTDTAKKSIELGLF